MSATLVNTLSWQKEWEEEDKRLGKIPEDITLDIYLNAANEVMECLEFTGEVSKNGNPIPCLDTQLWAAKAGNDGPWYNIKSQTEKAPGKETEGSQSPVIMYKFYRKPMRSKLTILKRSAQPENMKVATMSLEITRRMKTSSEYLPKSVFEDILVTFMDELSAMGYPLEWRRKVLQSSMKGYMRVLRKVEEGTTTRNREGYATKSHRRFKKLCGKTEWFLDLWQKTSLPRRKS